jgi:hypothetical protein
MRLDREMAHDGVDDPTLFVVASMFTLLTKRASPLEEGVDG